MNPWLSPRAYIIAMDGNATRRLQIAGREKAMRAYRAYLGGCYPNAYGKDAGDDRPQD